jgi:hypothetical protein
MGRGNFTRSRAALSEHQGPDGEGRNYCVACHRYAHFTPSAIKRGDTVCQLCHDLWTKHRLTRQRYEEMSAEQGHVCAVCKTTDFLMKGRLSVDHDHDCCPKDKSCGNCTRGLLCNRCNTFIGRGKDKLAVAAGEYIKRHTQRAA